MSLQQISYNELVPTITLKQIKDKSIVIHFIENKNKLDREYKLEYQNKNDVDDEKIEWKSKQITTTNQYELQSLNPNTTYIIRAALIINNNNNNYYGPYSKQLSFKTLPKIKNIIKDKFDSQFIGEQHILNGNIITHSGSELTATSSFGSKIVENGKFEWKFRIKKMKIINDGGSWSIVIGIWKVKSSITPPVNTWFTKDGNN
eukprot:312366_1